MALLFLAKKAGFIVSFNRFILTYTLSLFLGPLLMALVSSIFWGNKMVIHLGLLGLAVYFSMLSFWGIRLFSATAKTFFLRRFMVALWTLGISSVGAFLYFMSVLTLSVLEF